VEDKTGHAFAVIHGDLMPYTFQPKQKYAKASGSNVNASPKASALVCRAIRRKTLTRAKRLLNNLLEQRQSLDGKYYTKATREVLNLLSSCEKNAEFLGLETEKLMVHASATHGTIMNRRRRKAAFGSRIKAANIEIMLVERGRESKTKVSRKKVEEHLKKKETDVDKEIKKEHAALKDSIAGMREKSHEMKEKAHEFKEKAHGKDEGHGHEEHKHEGH
jgi:ribosomal protein L22